MAGDNFSLSMSQTQTVFRLPSKRSGCDALKAASEPVPWHVRPHEVLLQIHTTTLNYRDYAIASDIYPFPAKDTLVPCSDAAGEVIEVGDAVNFLSKGDWATINFSIENLYGPQKGRDTRLGAVLDGTLREYIAVPAIAVIPTPKTTKLSCGQLASLVCTGTTAWNSLYGNMPLEPGQHVSFIGTGSVSITGLILARAADKLKLAKETYGAGYTINYRNTPDWPTEANKITHGQGVDFVFENGGSGTIAQSVKCVAQGGIIAVIGFLVQAKEMPDVTALILGKGCIVRGTNFGPKQMTEDLVQFVCGKDLPMPVEKYFPYTPDGILDAFKFLGSGGHVGKICIEIIAW
ncbi:NAD(P)-binding protein [Polychaeton citri CBS 116435]|uniref:NAD(P)-binding protein n=1 Tax=Polychaeton citri CBS 116435 TaxID=1314669 RepID=A0A9P4Q359_9PEZI|nr:NAD(P)-binding protein [Polychaeton citri CBS 116435]